MEFPIGNSIEKPWANPLAVVTFVLVAWFVVNFALAPPAPVGMDAGPEQFSATRASETLTYLLGDESPHPVGSVANQAVRDRLMQHLQQLGLQPSIQATIGCAARYNVCANVENVVALIPGKSVNTIMLMAHYDSVPHAPGAADDGAGVAAILEIARILQLSEPRKNGVLLVLTDAEEVGLLGAEAFFAEHPSAANVKAVVNLEGSGSSGPSMLLRTTANGAKLIEAFQRGAKSPTAFSVAQEVFDRMPNDTDFSVSQRANIPSIDFAFSFDFSHYHTPIDTVANLDKGTLQHHGMNALPIVQGLIDADLGANSNPQAYFSTHPSIWIAWSTTMGVPLAGLAMFLMGFVTYRVWHQTDILNLSLGLISAVGVVILGAALTYALTLIGDLVAGTTPRFPAEPWPWRGLTYGGPLLSVSIVSALLGKRLGFWPRFLGTWWLLALISMALVVVAPLAANLLLIPTLIIAVLAGLVVIRESSHRLGLVLVSVAVVAYFMVLMAYANEQTQGLGVLAPSIYACLVIASLAFLPISSSYKFVGGCFAVICISLIWLNFAPLYSAWHPQHVSVHHVQNLDDKSAYRAALSANPLPEKLVQAFGSNSVTRKLTPWAPNELRTFETAFVPFQRGEMTSDRTKDKVIVKYTGSPDVDFFYLVVPQGERLQALQVEGRSLNPRLRNGVAQVAFFAPSSTSPVSIQLVFDDAQQVDAYLLEGRNTLPANTLAAAAARGELALPAHRGDQFMNYRKVQF